MAGLFSTENQNKILGKFDIEKNPLIMQGASSLFGSIRNADQTAANSRDNFLRSYAGISRQPIEEQPNMLTQFSNLYQGQQKQRESDAFQKALQKRALEGGVGYNSYLDQLNKMAQILNATREVESVGFGGR